MEKNYILVIDEKTTGVRSFIYNRNMEIVSKAYRRIQLIHPGPKEVEEDAQVIYDKTVEACREVVKKSGIDPNEIECVGLTNQRTTWVMWNKETGKPLYNMKTWLDSSGLHVKQKFIVDSAFNEKFPGVAPVLPGLFMPLQLDCIKSKSPEFVEEFNKSTTLYGNVDAWLIWNFTKGKVHATTSSTVSNSTIYVNNAESWNYPILEYFGVRPEMLPEIRDEADFFGMMSADIVGAEIPIYSAFADQQAALFSQNCLTPKTAKITNGTGTFVDVNIGSTYRTAGTLTPSIAWRMDGETTFMLEGSNFNAGVCLEWMKESLNMFDTFEEMNRLADSVEDSNGVFFVPALNGMSGVPFNDESARGAFLGLAGSSNRSHMIKAALQGIGFAAASIILEAQKSGILIEEIKLSGGVSRSSIIGQIIADVTGIPTVKYDTLEASAMGAAETAAIKAGWITKDDIKKYLKVENRYIPNGKEEIAENYSDWVNAVNRTLKWRC